MRPTSTLQRTAAWCFAAATAAGTLACAREPDAPAAAAPREVEVLTIAPTEVRDTGEYLGELISRESATVLPQVAGYVRAIEVRPGERVDAGTALVAIDSREEAAALKGARATRQSARARLALARQTRDRVATLARTGAASREELDAAQAELDTAAAVEREAAAAIRQREVQLQYHVVRAPVPGVVGEVDVRVGDYVDAATVLTTLSQTAMLELTIGVPAERARHLAIGAPVEVLDRDGRVLAESVVFYVAREAEPSTQLVEVKAKVANDSGLRTSEIVRARVVYSTRRALQLPLVAVVRQSGQAFAFVVAERDGQTIVERRPVELGPLGESAYRVESGIAPGDRVAISSVQALRDGVPIVPVAAEPDPETVARARVPPPARGGS